MTSSRARLAGAALLLGVAVSPACSGGESAPPSTTSTVHPTPSSPATSGTGEAGTVAFEVGGPPGAVAMIDWGVAPTASHTTETLPWRRTEIAPLGMFSVALQVALPPEQASLVSCRITVEGQEVISAAEPGMVLCTAMGLTRTTRTARP